MAIWDVVIHWLLNYFILSFLFDRFDLNDAKNDKVMAEPGEEYER